MSNIFIGLKNTCLGVLDRRKRDKVNETGLKEGGGIEMSTTVLHSCASLSLLIYLPCGISTFGYTFPKDKTSGSHTTFPELCFATTQWIIRHGCLIEVVVWCTVVGLYNNYSIFIHIICCT